MNYYIFVENGKTNGAGQCRILNEEITCVEVTEGIYNKFIETPNFYMAQLVDDEWVIVENPEFENEELVKAKKEKQQENIEKCNEKRYNQEFMITLQDKECLFDTTKGTEDDLKTAFLACSVEDVYPNWVCNNYVVIDLTMEDVLAIQARMRLLSSPLYLIQKDYFDKIEACTTAEEVRAIEINYEINEEE